MILDALSAELLGILSVQVLYTSIAFLLALVASYCIKERFPYLLIAVWSLVLIRMMMPPDLASPVSLRQIIEWLAPAREAAAMAEPVLESQLAMTETFSGKAFSGLPWIRWRILFVLSWPIGVAALFLRYRGQRTACRTILDVGTRVDTPEVLSLVASWRARFRIRRPVEVVTGDATLSPFTMGILRPRVYIPGALLSRTSLEPILAHELGHIRRFDDLWIRLQHAVQNLFFFHPAIWIANRQISAARELLCDRLVLNTGVISATHYGESLLTTLEECRNQVLTPTFAGVREHLRQRFFQLVNPRDYPRHPKLWRIALVLIASACVLPMAPGWRPSIENRLVALLSQQPAAHELGIALQLPIEGGTVIAPYGIRDASSRFEPPRHIHPGIDIAAPFGTAVGAVAPGYIRRAVAPSKDIFSMIWGGYVVIDHGDGLLSYYGPLEQLAVRAGESVAAGDVLGVVGQDHVRSSGPHIHLEIMKDGLPLDPARILGVSGTTAARPTAGAGTPDPV